MRRAALQRNKEAERNCPKPWDKPKACKNFSIQRDDIGFFGPDGTIVPAKNQIVNVHVTKEDGTIEKKEVDSKILFLPLIRYRTRCKVMVNGSSSWEEGNEEKYFRPAVIPIMLFYEKYDNYDNRSIEELINRLRRRGIIVKSTLTVKSNGNETWKEMLDKCKSIEDGKGICVGIGGDENFKHLLHACEVGIVAPTVHIPLKSVISMHFLHIVQKINLRMSGVNHVLTSSNEQKKANDRYFQISATRCQVNENTDVHLTFFADTMVMAFDYSSKKSDSVTDGKKDVSPMTSVGFTYSTNCDGNVTGGGNFYIPDYTFPLHAENFQSPLEQALRHFKRHMFYFPTRIVVLRNTSFPGKGGNAQIDLEDFKVEAKNFECAFKNVQKLMNDDELKKRNLLFITISQDHKFGVSKADNPDILPGCCIDNTITDANFEQFLMFPSAPHVRSPFLATIVYRSAFDDHLTVIQQIILNLCYLYEVGTTAVEIPAPLKCAKEMADRGIDNLNIVLKENREEFLEETDNLYAANELAQPLLINRYNA